MARIVDRRRRTQRAQFFAGRFKVRQRRGVRPFTDIELQSSDLARVCRATPRGAATTFAARRRSKKVVAKLWGDGKGRFRTKGRHSAGAVRGTRWLTQERCDGTLTTVRRGSVAVRDLRLRRTFVVRAPRSYLARAPG